MKCLTLVLKHIGIVFGMFGSFIVVTLMLIYAGFLTQQFFDLDRLWAPAFFIIYFMIFLGAFMGIVQCYQEKKWRRG